MSAVVEHRLAEGRKLLQHFRPSRFVRGCQVQQQSLLVPDQVEIEEGFAFLTGQQLVEWADIAA
ncbi:hypothetical protein [Streptomyces rapamycinicus]|uniref:hypothetical protein n=1 Tax=Streptomyces rapamycinicus TaxID=1226757 RepID=UPI0020C9F061|nr:hypothetical protein [Streptomyces rapamycinicus]UTP34975.1 hypothetical protein LIV37_40175 [Streptomyces rapamycinicus NRRL 5491]